MNILITIICCALTLTACVQTAGTTAVAEDRPNGDIRTISAMSSMAGTGNVALMAARACDKENKKLNVISTTTQTGITGTVYPVIVFKCE